MQPSSGRLVTLASKAPKTRSFSLHLISSLSFRFLPGDILLFLVLEHPAPVSTLGLCTWSLICLELFL